MNILMVHPHDLFDKSEPWTIRVKNIAKEFTKKSHKVKICYFPMTINKIHLPKIEGSIELIPLKRTPSPTVFIINTLKLIKLCKWADVVHLQKCQHYASIPTITAAYITSKSLHYDWDDWEEKIWYESCGKGFHSRFIGTSFKVLERWLPVLADSVSCSSRSLRNLAYKFGVDENRVFDSPVGADLEKFKPNLCGDRVKEQYNIRGDLVLYIGQLHGGQYVDLFIKAANIILRKNPDVTFMIVGDGFLRQHLEKMVLELGLENNVIFTGSVSYENIPYYIAASEVCVACFKDTEVAISKSPLKIVEYLASGKAVVASNVGEVRNMVGGVGLLVKPSDYHILADGILSLLENKLLREKLGKRARCRAEEKYNWAYTADNILKAYSI